MLELGHFTILPYSVPKPIPHAVVLMKVHCRERTRRRVSDLIIASHTSKQRHEIIKEWEKKGTDTTRNFNARERSGGGGRKVAARQG